MRSAAYTHDERSKAYQVSYPQVLVCPKYALSRDKRNRLPYGSVPTYHWELDMWDTGPS